MAEPIKDAITTQELDRDMLLAELKEHYKRLQQTMEAQQRTMEAQHQTVMDKLNAIEAARAVRSLKVWLAIKRALGQVWAAFDDMFRIDKAEDV